MLAATLSLLAALVPGPQAPAQTPSAPQSAAATKAAQEEKNHEADVKGDVEMGNKYAIDVEKENKLSTDKAATDRVQRIGAEVAVIANSGAVNCLWGDKRLNKFNYVYKVIQGDDVNAFSLPGGHVYVYEGLVKRVESDDELAGVLAHETAHAAFRHVATLQREEQKMMNISLPLILLSIFAGHGGSATGNTLEVANLIMQAKGSGWSVQAEQAADYGGFQYLLKSHYDPSGMLTFMERLADEERTSDSIDWGIYRTHPPGKERAEALTKEMKDAGLPVRRSRVTTTYRVTVHPADNGKVELDFGKRPLVSLSGSDALTRADASASALNDFFDTTPELFEVQAGPGGVLTGRGKPILSLEAADASAASENLTDLQQQVLKNMRMALFTLGYRVWSTHT